jgi:hypothetical protein
MFTDSTIDPQILEETPEKALRFLRAMAIKAEIRIAMFAYGYTEQEQAHGWQLLLDANGYTPTELPFSNDRVARAAIAEVDSWDESGFRRMQAALGRLHPEQAAFVFEGVSPGQGANAVVSVATVLERLDALESSPDREASHDADRAALETLARRGIDKTERERLARLVVAAQGAGVPSAAEAQSQSAEQRTQALEALRAWYHDWSETARAVIRRRDYLVMLGLVKRRVRRPSTSDVEGPSNQPA